LAGILQRGTGFSAWNSSGKRILSLEFFKGKLKGSELGILEFFRIKCFQFGILQQ
jgi:hypothetical protein